MLQKKYNKIQILHTRIYIQIQKKYINSKINYHKKKL